MYFDFSVGVNSFQSEKSSVQVSAVPKLTESFKLNAGNVNKTIVIHDKKLNRRYSSLAWMGNVRSALIYMAVPVSRFSLAEAFIFFFFA